MRKKPPADFLTFRRRLHIGIFWRSHFIKCLQMVYPEE